MILKEIKEVELFIVIKEGTEKYYLLKVVRRGFDVYCFPPGLGVHYSRHKSGESHFRSEEKEAKPDPFVDIIDEYKNPNGKVDPSSLSSDSEETMA